MTRPIEPRAEKAVTLLNAIAHAASEANQLCSRFDPVEGDIEHYELQLHLLQETVNRMGWMADLASSRLGGPMVIGGAAAWLAPAAFNAPNGGAA